MQRTWDKIKAYLSNWKTTNFGNGTYSNSGSITINENSTLRVEKVLNDVLGSQLQLGSRIVADELSLFSAVHTNTNQRTGIYTNRGIAIIQKSSNPFNPGMLGFNRTVRTLYVGVISLKSSSDEASSATVNYKYVSLEAGAQLQLPEGVLHLVFWTS